MSEQEVVPHDFTKNPSSLASLRARYAADLEAAVDEVVEQLRGLPEVRRVILFGSFARGRRDLHTDLDLLVIMDSDLDFVARNAAVAGQIRCGVALDLLVYTPAEIARTQEQPFLRHALATGKVVYENDLP